MTKKEIRAYMSARRRQLSVEDIQLNSRKIRERFYKEQVAKQQIPLYCYISFLEEVSTLELIEEAWSQKQTVAVPKIVEQQMKFFYITSWSDVTEGRFHILEPTTKEEAKDKEVILIMPGLAFDQTFHRIGYGGGFYDKYIEKAEKEKVKLHKIAFSYSFQIVKQLEVTCYDKKVDKIITPYNSYERNRTIFYH